MLNDLLMFYIHLFVRSCMHSCIQSFNQSVNQSIIQLAVDVFIIDLRMHPSSSTFLSTLLHAIVQFINLHNYSFIHNFKMSICINLLSEIQSSHVYFSDHRNIQNLLNQGINTLKYTFLQYLIRSHRFLLQAGLSHDRWPIGLPLGLSLFVHLLLSLQRPVYPPTNSFTESQNKPPDVKLKQIIGCCFKKYYSSLPSFQTSKNHLNSRSIEKLSKVAIIIRPRTRLILLVRLNFGASTSFFFNMGLQKSIPLQTSANQRSCGIFRTSQAPVTSR